MSEKKVASKEQAGKERIEEAIREARACNALVAEKLNRLITAEHNLCEALCQDKATEGATLRDLYERACNIKFAVDQVIQGHHRALLDLGALMLEARDD